MSAVVNCHAALAALFLVALDISHDITGSVGPGHPPSVSFHERFMTDQTLAECMRPCTYKCLNDACVRRRRAHSCNSFMLYFSLATRALFTGVRRYKKVKSQLLSLQLANLAAAELYLCGP